MAESSDEPWEGGAARAAAQRCPARRREGRRGQLEAWEPLGAGGGRGCPTVGSGDPKAGVVSVAAPGGQDLCWGAGRGPAVRVAAARRALARVTLFQRGRAPGFLPGSLDASEGSRVTARSLSELLCCGSSPACSCFKIFINRVPSCPVKSTIRTAARKTLVPWH